MNASKSFFVGLLLVLPLVFACGSETDSENDTTVDGQTTKGPAGELIIGDFTIWSGIFGEQRFNDIVINRASGNSNSEGEPLYTGYDQDFTSIIVDVGWSPAANAYVMTHHTTASRNIIYTFNINADRSLTGTSQVTDAGAVTSNGTIDSTKSFRYDSGYLTRSVARVDLSRHVSNAP